MQYTWNLWERLKQVHRRAREVTGQAMRRQKLQHDRRAQGSKRDVGDLVWLITKVRKQGRAAKFEHKCKGPFTMPDVIADITYRKEDKKGKRIVVNGERLIPFVKPDDWSSTEGAEEEAHREPDLETFGDSESGDADPDVRPGAAIPSKNGKEAETPKEPQGGEKRELHSAMGATTSTLPRQGELARSAVRNLEIWCGTRVITTTNSDQRGIDKKMEKNDNGEHCTYMGCNFADMKMHYIRHHTDKMMVCSDKWEKGYYTVSDYHVVLYTAFYPSPHPWTARDDPDFPARKMEPKEEERIEPGRQMPGH